MMLDMCCGSISCGGGGGELQEVMSPLLSLGEEF